MPWTDHGRGACVSNLGYHRRILQHTGKHGLDVAPLIPCLQDRPALALSDALASADHNDKTSRCAHCGRLGFLCPSHDSFKALRQN